MGKDINLSCRTFDFSISGDLIRKVKKKIRVNGKDITVTADPKRDLEYQEEYIKKIDAGNAYLGYIRAESYDYDPNNCFEWQGEHPYPPVNFSVLSKMYAELVADYMVYITDERAMEFAYQMALKTKNGSLHVGRISYLEAYDYNNIDVLYAIEVKAVSDSEIELRLDTLRPQGASFSYMIDCVKKVKDSLNQGYAIGKWGLPKGVTIKDKARRNETPVSELKEAKEGQVIAFGATENWIVLKKEDDRMLIMTETPLELENNYCSKSDIFKDCTWENLQARFWLNRFYFNECFSENERALILETELVNFGDPKNGLDGGNNTVDKIFIPSKEDAEKYIKPLGEMMCGQPWLLRNRSKEERGYSYVSDVGRFTPAGRVQAKLRPMMWIRTSH